ncbi:MAG: amidohydrolase [Deltaproteobacteria bacterium]|nr:amidohydrolase [Deltaproteobacteria bacterium]
MRTVIVDTHVHVISDDQSKYPRRADTAKWVTDTSGEMLLSLNHEAGIDKTVLVQGYGAYEYDNSYAADCARAHPDRFACVVIVDQRQRDAAERLDYWVKERGARGLRLVTATEPETFLDDPQTFPVWQRAVALGIPICIMTRFHQVERLQAVLERFPNVLVALDHLGAPRLSDGPPYASLQPLFDLARYPNVYLKFSTETLYAARRGKSNSREFFGRILDRFSANRLLWGSNFPATHDRPLKEQLALAREDLSFVPAEQQRWLFGETALSLWPELR